MRHLIGTLWTVQYTNYRGINSIRNIRVKDLFVGSNKYHPQQQLLVKVYDYDKKAERTFAAKDINNWIRQQTKDDITG